LERKTMMAGTASQKRVLARSVELT
jgi:hypothetical protein